MSDADAPEATLEELSYAADERRVSFVLDEEIYPRDAIYGAAYLFVDRAWIFLTRPGDKQVEVRLKPKDPEATSVEALDAIAGEFANELLNQLLRTRVGESTRDLREYYMARAFFGDDTRASIDALLAELDAEELAEDELEVSVPWDSPAADDTPGATGG